ncbi:MAG: T9SS type A sorting domain-containing protein [Saprospiraceae bacterium]
MTTKTMLLAAFLTAFFLAPLTAQNYSIYVSDAGNFSNPPWQILKFDANGQNGQVLVNQNLAWPQDIFFLENENTMLVSNLNNGRITKFNASSGAHLGEFATGIGGPTRMKLGSDSLLYVLQWQGNGKVKRYNLSGTFVGDFTASGVPASIGLDWDTAGNLYVSSYSGKYVRKFSPTGANLGNFISSNLVGPTNIWFEENGDLLVVDYEDESVKRFDSQGNYKGIFISGLPNGEGVDFLPNGNIIIGSGGTSSVRVYDAAGTLLNTLVPPGTLNLLVPNAVVLRPASASATQEAYREMAFVIPSVGTVFQFANPQNMEQVKTLEVYNSVGVFVRKINFADSTSWDASNLAAGIYHITARLQDGVIGRQTVVVQR